MYDSFWRVLNAQVNKWQGTLLEENFGAITKEGLALLKAGSAVLPGLTGWDGSL